PDWETVAQDILGRAGIHSFGSATDTSLSDDATQASATDDTAPPTDGRSVQSDEDALRAAWVGAPVPGALPLVEEARAGEAGRVRAVKQRRVARIAGRLAAAYGDERADLAVDPFKGLVDPRTRVQTVRDLARGVGLMVGRHPARRLRGVRVVYFGDGDA